MKLSEMTTKLDEELFAAHGVVLHRQNDIDADVLVTLHPDRSAAVRCVFNFEVEKEDEAIDAMSTVKEIVLPMGGRIDGPGVIGPRKNLRHSCSIAVVLPVS